MMNLELDSDSSIDVVNFSRMKLRNAAEALRDWVTEDCLEQHPCEMVTETINYRCKCAFQIVWIESMLHFAVRHNQVPVLSDIFPIANPRIQFVMTLLQWTLNEHKDNFQNIRRHLTSVSFSSAWRGSNDTDCLVTLFYDNRIEDEMNWKDEAERLHHILQVTQVSGRSKKQFLRAIESTDTMVRDSLWILNSLGVWRVSLTDPSRLCDVDSTTWIRRVKYEKPEGAFFHPNANAMCTALEWLVRRVHFIHQSSSKSKHRRRRLLELYCGCGAHTVALMQTQMLESIVAVELDERLVEACKRNVRINQCANTSSNEIETLVHVVSDDAGIWAKTFVNNSSGSQIEDSASRDGDRFDVLLVDPPRQGLDENVCRMVNYGSFQDLLYISCGKDALIRDLKRLSCNFEVLDCKLLDLFPQTDAVESLMHLRRKRI